MLFLFSYFFFFFSSRRRHTRWPRDWSSDVCSSDLTSTLGQTPIPGGVLDRGLFVYRPNGTIGPTLSHNPHLNAEGVVIADASGQNIQMAMVVDFPNNRAGLEISNMALKQQVRIGSVSDTGILQLFDSSGNV